MGYAPVNHAIIHTGDACFPPLIRSQGIKSMTISQTQFLPDVESDEAISHGSLAYLQERTRNQLFDFILKKFLEAQENGLTKAKLARRIHRSPEVITRLLGSPGNWTISTISDLLAGIAAEELVPNSEQIGMNPPML